MSALPRVVISAPSSGHGKTAGSAVGDTVDDAGTDDADITVEAA
jgi:hypothetical protein